jgi:hypothetical protein
MEKEMFSKIKHFYLGILFFSSFALIFVMNKGLDVTDESYYLLKITQPFEDIVSLVLFGELYQLFFFGDQSLFSIRLIGFALLNISALLLISRICRFFQIDKLAGYSLMLFALQVYYWSNLLLTPSYNLLSLSASLVVAGAMLQLVLDESKKPQALFVILLSFGLSVLYLAKPSSAALLAVIVTLLVCVFLKERGAIKIISSIGILSLSFTCIAILLIFESMTSYFESLRVTLKLSSALGGGHDLSSIGKSLYVDFLKLMSPLRFIPKNIFILPFFLLWSKWKTKVENHSARLIVFNLIYQVFVLFLIGNIINYIEILFYQLIILLFYFYKFSKEENKRRYYLLVGISFFTLIASRFGTNNSLFLQGQANSILMWAPIVVLAMTVFKNEKWIHFYFSALIIATSGLAYRSIQEPYRAVTPIWEHNNVLSTKKFDFALERNTFDWAKQLIDVAHSSGFQTGNFLIDMTGGSPGAVLLLDAKFLGIPWILGGYSGSDEYFKAALSYSACRDLSKAWLLISSNGSRKVDPKNLKHFGLNLEEDYLCVGDFLFDGHRKENQTICKPKDNLETKLVNCKKTNV